MNQLLLALLGVATPALAQTDHKSVTTDIITATVGNIIPVSVSGLDDWNISVDGTVFCQSEEGFLARLSITNPAWSSGRVRPRDESVAAEIEFQVLSLDTGRSLPADTSGTCLLTDRAGHIRELRYEMSVVDRVARTQSIKAIRLAPGSTN